MRAARAARSSIGIDGITFRRGTPPSPDHVVAMPRGKVRAPAPLSPHRVGSKSLRAPATKTTTTGMTTKKPKRVPKGSSANKRSRALRTALDGVGGGRGRGPVSNDVTSRFPMPYPGGVERGRPPRAIVPATGRAPHYQREKTRTSSPEGKVRANHHADDRETLRMPVASPGVARRHRKRPRSAVLPPSRAEFGGPIAPPTAVLGLIAKKEPSSKLKRNTAELSGATPMLHGGGGRGARGGKKLRWVVCRGSYAYAPTLPCQFPFRTSTYRVVCFGYLYGVDWPASPKLTACNTCGCCRVRILSPSRRLS